VFFPNSAESLIRKNVKKLHAAKVAAGAPEANHEVVLRAMQDDSPLCKLLLMLPAVIDSLPCIFVFPIPQIVNCLVSAVPRFCCRGSVWEQRRAVAILSGIDEEAPDGPVGVHWPLEKATFCESVACAPCLQGQLLEHVEGELEVATETPRMVRNCEAELVSYWCDICGSCGMLGEAMEKGVGLTLEVASKDYGNKEKGASAAVAAQRPPAGAAVVADHYDGDFAFAGAPSQGALTPA
jgi:hypothetical protein